MKMAILGINGKMGSQVYEYYKDKIDIYGISINHYNSLITYFNSIKDIKDTIDVLIDFSSDTAYDELVYALNNNIKVISGTTSYTFEQINKLKELGGSLFYHSVNFSKGIDLFKRLILECNKELYLIDFVEIHQKTKKDAPSGTARMLANEIGFKDEDIQALRINFSKAIHELIFASKNERIIIMHEVIDSEAFIEGLDEVLKKMVGDYSD